MTSEYENRGFAPVVNERWNTVESLILAGTGAAQQLPDLVCYELILQANPSNASNILLGDASVQSIIMQPGFTLLLTVENANLLYAEVAVGDFLNLLALREV